MADAQYEQMAAMMAASMTRFPRVPVKKTPKDYGMEFEDVQLKTKDGLKLAGWLMLAKEPSKKVVVCNHFGGSNKYGWPIPEEKTPMTPNVEVEFIPKYKHLVEAGYNVLAYDLRNHGDSDAFQDGRNGLGIAEAQDVLASLEYVRSRKETADNKISLVSLCFGCISTWHAMQQAPDAFKGVACMAALQPPSLKALAEAAASSMGMDEEKFVSALDVAMKKEAGCDVAKCGAAPVAKGAADVPTLLVQVKEDVMVKPYDIEETFAALPMKDKKLFYIEGTKVRYDGYNYFGKDPKVLLEWLAAHN